MDIAILLSLLSLFFIGYTTWTNAYEYNTFEATVTSIGGNEGTIMIASEQAVTDNLIIPANIMLRFIQGGSLNVSVGKTVTINGNVEAPPVEIFEGAGTVIVNTYPQDQAWWGNPQRGDRGPTFFYGDIYTDRWLESDTNTFVGVGVVGAGNLAAGGIENTAVGNNALNANTVATRCTAIGYNALLLNTIGSYNTAVGSHTLITNIDGAWNTAVGYGALFHNTGDYNVAVGGTALYDCSIGEGNVAFGTGSLHDLTIGNYNTGLGDNAGFPLTLGAFNIFIGYNAGYGLTPANAPLTDDYGILIGWHANRSVASANHLVNYIGIGKGTVIDKDNQTKIGNDDTVECYLRGSMLLDLASVPAHANNAAAAGGGVAVGGIYRTNADPSVLCIRSA